MHLSPSTSPHHLIRYDTIHPYSPIGTPFSRPLTDMASWTLIQFTPSIHDTASGRRSDHTQPMDLSSMLHLARLLYDAFRLQRLIMSVFLTVAPSARLGMGLLVFYFCG